MNSSYTNLLKAFSKKKNKQKKIFSLNYLAYTLMFYEKSLVMSIKKNK